MDGKKNEEERGKSQRGMVVCFTDKVAWAMLCQDGLLQWEASRSSMKEKWT